MGTLQELLLREITTVVKAELGRAMSEIGRELVFGPDSVPREHAAATKRTKSLAKEIKSAAKNQGKRRAKVVARPSTKDAPKAATKKSAGKAKVSRGAVVDPSSFTSKVFAEIMRGEKSPALIADKLAVDSKRVNGALVSLKRQNRVTSVGRGLYTVANGAAHF